MSARSLNKVILIGNLTKDPELRYTPSGTAVCSFSVATNRDWVDPNGQKQEEVEFTRVVAWSKLAEICSQLLNKGRKVYVEGRLRTRAWKSQDGQDRQVTEVVISEMIALGDPKGGASYQGGEPTAAYDDNAVAADQATSAEAVNPEEVFVPDEEVVKDEKPPKTKKKSMAEEVADDIPF